MPNIQILKLSKTKTAAFAFSFTALAVLTPIIFHFIGGAALGKAFLPMHIFILAAGLILGWPAGLAVGILTPFISYSLTGMPVVAILPLVIIETILYGFLSGIFGRRLNIFLALVGTLFLGRLFLMAAILILPTNFDAVAYVFGAIKSGWPGVLLQLAILPIIVKMTHKFLQTEIS